jgi:hypothetical protein
MAVFRNIALGLVFGDSIDRIYPHSLSLFYQKYHEDFKIFLSLIQQFSVCQMVQVDLKLKDRRSVPTGRNKQWLSLLGKYQEAHDPYVHSELFLSINPH